MSPTPEQPAATSLPSQIEESIYARLRELEQRSHTQKRANLALLAGLVLLLLLAAGALASGGQLPDEITASRYLLTDGDGVTRGTWAVLPSGGTHLTLHDRNGVPRVKLTLLDEGFPGIALTDSRGLSRAVLGLLPDGTATLAFADPGGNTRAVVGVGADATSHLVFVDVNGQTRVSLGTAADGAPGFMLFEDTVGANAEDAADADATATAPRR